LFFLAPAQLFYRDIQAEVEGPPRKLIETVAERIAAGILAQHGRVHSVRVGICKPHVAVAGVVQSLGVEITRRRGQN
jgi:dihydroneopterin aldolase